MSKGRFELVFGLSAIVICGALAWGIGHYRDFQVAWYKRKFVTADRAVCYEYVQKLAALGSVADPCLRRIVVLSEELPQETITITQNDWSTLRRQIRNNHDIRVLLLTAVDSDEEVCFKKNPSSWITTMERTLQWCEVLEPGETLPWDGPVKGAK